MFCVTLCIEYDSQDNGDLKPKRIRDINSIIQTSLGQASKAAPTGASSFIFTPDSTKLVMSTTMSGYILVIDLGTADNKPRVLRRFEQHRMQNIVVGNRVVKGRKAVEETEDVEMGEDRKDDPKDGSDNDESSESEDEDKQMTVTVTRMAVSPDGQWLATADDRSRTHVFNLDSIQVRTISIQSTQMSFTHIDHYHNVLAPLRPSLVPSTDPRPHIRSLLSLNTHPRTRQQHSPNLRRRIPPISHLVPPPPQLPPSSLHSTTRSRHRRYLRPRTSRFRWYA